MSGAKHADRRAVQPRFKPYTSYKNSGVEWLGEIPAHWEVKRLKREFRVVNGSTPASGEPAFWDGDIPWVTPEDLGDLTGTTIVATRRNITDAGYRSCGTTLVPAGSLVLSTRAPIGHLAIAGVGLCTNQGCRSLVFRNARCRLYYSYQVLAARPELESLGQGGTFRELAKGMLEDVELVVAPDPEQRAIAAFLDRETARIDAPVAKKVAAFFRMSRSRVTRARSLRSFRFSSSRKRASGSLREALTSPPSTNCRFHVWRRLLCTPRPSATSLSGRPCSTTIFTASSLNSIGYFRRCLAIGITFPEQFSSFFACPRNRGKINSELGAIPEGWDVGTFRTFSNIAEHLRDSENPLDSSDAVFSHFSIPAFDDGQWPKQELGQNIKSLKSRVPSGVVLLSKLNPEIERVWLVDAEPRARAICSTEFLVLRPRAPHGRAFVYCLARSALFRQGLEGLVTGTSKSHQRAQVGSILELAVAMPPTPLVSRFENAAEPLLARGLECRRESRTLAALRDTLLPKLISGELRVNDAEKVIGRVG